MSRKNVTIINDKKYVSYSSNEEPERRYDKTFVELYPLLNIGSPVALAPAWYGTISDCDPYRDWYGVTVRYVGLRHMLVAWRNGYRTVEHMAHLIIKRPPPEPEPEEQWLGYWHPANIYEPRTRREYKTTRNRRRSPNRTYHDDPVVSATRVQRKPW